MKYHQKIWNPVWPTVSNGLTQTDDSLSDTNLAGFSLKSDTVLARSARRTSASYLLTKKFWSVLDLFFFIPSFRRIHTDEQRQTAAAGISSFLCLVTTRYNIIQTADTGTNIMIDDRLYIRRNRSFALWEWKWEKQGNLGLRDTLFPLQGDVELWMRSGTHWKELTPSIPRWKWTYVQQYI